MELTVDAISWNSSRVGCFAMQFDADGITTLDSQSWGRFSSDAIDSSARSAEHSLSMSIRPTLW